MASALEFYDFNSSLKQDENNYIFKDKQFQYFNDLSNGSFGPNSSEVKFELISLANTNDFINWSESYVLLPLTMSVEVQNDLVAPTGFGAVHAENAFAMSLKNSYSNIVDSLYISVNDNPINQMASFSNVDQLWRMYQMSGDDRKTIADSMNFYLDNGDSLQYIPTTGNKTVSNIYYNGTIAITAIDVAGLVTITALGGALNLRKGQQFSYLAVIYTVITDVVASGATTFNVLPKPPVALATAVTTGIFTPADVTTPGLGLCNNSISKATLFNPKSGFKSTNGYVNSGRAKRMQSTSYDPSQLNNTYFSSAAQIGNELKNFVQENTATKITYYIFATIPMSILHDFFDKLPLTRGLSVRLNLYLNTGITITETISKNQHVSIESFVMPRSTCPFMVSPICNDNIHGSGFVNSGTATSVKYTLTLGNDSQRNARFYASMMSFTPEYESLYVSRPIRKILYNDFAQFTIPSVAPTGTVNQLITSGISRIRGILIAPYVSANSNGCYGLTSPQSPFSSCPSTCFPGKISNFQIQVNGRPLFSTPLQHSFNFYNNVRNELSINGGSMRSTGMSSGCISKTDWESAYGFYYVNLSHFENESDDNTSKSIQILFLNQTVGTINLDFQVLVYFEKQISLDISVGKCVDA